MEASGAELADALNSRQLLMSDLDALHVNAREQICLIICPGGSGNPDSPKLKCLAEVTETLGVECIRPDWTGVAVDPEPRLELLRHTKAYRHPHLVLAGSSLGGYVAALAAEGKDVEGLFLLAPIYAESRDARDYPQPRSRDTIIIHAWDDEFAYPAGVFEYAQAIGATLHLLCGDHSLEPHFDFIAREFTAFLNRIIAQPSSRSDLGNVPRNSGGSSGR